MMINIKAPELSIRRQCELIGLSRSSFYYQKATESALNLELMHLLDEAYTRHPFLGRPRLTHYLRSLGYKVNEKRVSRLMGLMDLRAIYPAPKTTQASKEHKVYPYLLRDIEITGPNQVWSADITYVPMHKGFMYLMAILDWYSRYVIAYRLSNSLDNYFCIEALNQALSTATPLIFNTDQAGSSPPGTSRTDSRRPVPGSAWMAGVACSTTSSSNDSGAPSNMRTSTSTSMTPCRN